jgi:hypothetical protein
MDREYQEIQNHKTAKEQTSLQKNGYHSDQAKTKNDPKHQRWSRKSAGNTKAK